MSDLLGWAQGARLADAQAAAGEQLLRMQAEAQHVLLTDADGAAMKRLAAHLDLACALASVEAGAQLLHRHGTAAALQRMRSAALAAPAHEGGGGGAEAAARDLSEALLVLEAHACACCAADAAPKRPSPAAWEACAALAGAVL